MTPGFYQGQRDELEKAAALWMQLPPAWDFTMTPKQRWKAQQSAVRWERRYGRPKEIFKGEIGTFSGFRVIRSVP